MNSKKEGNSMKSNLKRTFIAVAVFVVIYTFSALLLGYKQNDVRFLGAIIAAGCYWLGSNSSADDEK